MGVARGKLIVGQEYAHYQTGAGYRITDFAQDPNTEQIFVIYRDMKKEGISNCRPLDEFCSKFSKVKNSVSKKAQERRPARRPPSPF